MKKISRYYLAICLTAIMTIEPTTEQAMKWYFPIVLVNMLLSVVLFEKYGQPKTDKSHEQYKM